MHGNFEYNLGPENINLIPRTLTWPRIRSVLRKPFMCPSIIFDVDFSPAVQNPTKTKYEYLYITNRYVCLDRFFWFFWNLWSLHHRHDGWKKTTDNPNRALYRVYIIISIIILETTNMVRIRDTFSIIIFVISYYYYTHSHCMMPPNDAPQHTILNQTNLLRSILLYMYIDNIIMVKTTVYNRE